MPRADSTAAMMCEVNMVTEIDGLLKGAEDLALSERRALCCR
jgi:hypothetical protein